MGIERKSYIDRVRCKFDSVISVDKFSGYAEVSGIINGKEQTIRVYPDVNVLEDTMKQFDEIYDIIDSPRSKFAEIFGIIGGKRTVARVYTDGTVVER